MKKITLNNLQDVFKSKPMSRETAELKGYELIEELFVDSSGFGAQNEAAYTKSQFQNKLEQILKENPTVYTCLTGVGQFQVYCGVFTRTGTKACKRIGANTYRVQYPTSEAIRLYDTDILTFESDHVTLNNGGFQTKTTKERLNQFLPSGVHITQKNYQWTVHDSRDQTSKEFVNGMTIAS